jgi:hypothetical protein
MESVERKNESKHEAKIAQGATRICDEEEEMREQMTE